MAHWGAVEPETTDRPNAMNAVNAVNAVDAVDAIIGQWAQVRPDLRTDAMAVFGRIYRIARSVGELALCTRPCWLTNWRLLPETPPAE